jgi:hypothetical protein
MMNVKFGNAASSLYVSWVEFAAFRLSHTAVAERRLRIKRSRSERNASFQFTLYRLTGR